MITLYHIIRLFVPIYCTDKNTRIVPNSSCKLLQTSSLKDYSQNTNLRNVKDKRPIVISGPSGCGKSTIINRLISTNPLFVFPVSHTTRQKRDYEVEGIDYFFVTKEEFTKMIKDDKFLIYTNYNNHLYGKTYAQLENQDKIAIFDFDSQGVENLSKMEFDYRSIFLYCSKDELLIRLFKRQKLNIERLQDIFCRLAVAEADIERYKNIKYDLCIENKDINETLAVIDEFIYQNEEKIESLDAAK